MKILSIDTASDICGVSILEDDKLICKLDTNTGRTHSENLMPMINEVFNKDYNWFITRYYIYNKIPLLEYINITRSSLYYEDILINKENSKKLLRRVKKEVSLDNRILFGLPITKKELTKINSK